MGAYNTGTSYRRTYNPCFVILFPMKHWKTERIARITWHKQSQPNSVFLYLINASRNAFLDTLVAASNSDTWPLITSTYGFPFPSFFGAFAALNVSITPFIRAWKIKPSHPAVFHSHGDDRAVLRFLHTHMNPLLDCIRIIFFLYRPILSICMASSNR